MPSSFLIAYTAVVVSLVWVGSLFIGAVEKDWTPLTITTPTMFLMAGWAFGLKVIQRQRSNGNGDH